MHGMRTSILVGVAALCLLLGLSPPPTSAARSAAMPSDFNGDGYADLAIGVPYEDTGRRKNNGAVNVLYGSRTGLRAGGDQLWTQDSPGVKGRTNTGDHFGWALASGDFDRDGYADLAIGIPDQRIDLDCGSGAVAVLYGSRAGLSADGDQLWSRANLRWISMGCHGLGFALAAGDFDGDGYWDLAMGDPQASPDGNGFEGTVVVLPGGSGGLGTAGARELSRAMTGAPDDLWAGFGGSVAAGDLNGDGFADLAVGAPGCRYAVCPAAAGDVGVFYGSAAGLDAAGSASWSQDSPGIVDEAEDGDRFGGALAIGDFDADGYADLAVGARGEAPPTCRTPCAGGGAVAVLHGSPAGISADRNQLWHQDVDLVPGAVEAGDGLGSALAAGDFDGDGFHDLAIGVPGEGSAARPQRGVVLVLVGGAGGLTAAGSRTVTESTPGVPGASEAGDRFGSVLASADYGRSWRDDLAIGVPRESVGAKTRAGKVNVLYGRTSGLSGLHAQAWRQGAAGVGGATERGDNFGFALTP